jgi:hypothetical protein
MALLSRHKLGIHFLRFRPHEKYPKENFYCLYEGCRRHPHARTDHLPGDLQLREDSFAISLARRSAPPGIHIALRRAIYRKLACRVQFLQHWDVAPMNAEHHPRSLEQLETTEVAPSPFRAALLFVTPIPQLPSRLDGKF